MPETNRAATLAQCLVYKRINHVTIVDLVDWLEYIVSVGMWRGQQHRYHIVDKDVPTGQIGFANTRHDTIQQPLTRMMPHVVRAWRIWLRACSHEQVEKRHAYHLYVIHIPAYNIYTYDSCSYWERTLSCFTIRTRGPPTYKSHCNT